MHVYSYNHQGNTCGGFLKNLLFLPKVTGTTVQYTQVGVTHGRYPGWMQPAMALLHALWADSLHQRLAYNCLHINLCLQQHTASRAMPSLMVPSIRNSALLLCIWVSSWCAVDVFTNTCSPCVVARRLPRCL